MCAKKNKIRVRATADTCKPRLRTAYEMFMAVVAGGYSLSVRTLRPPAQTGAKRPQQYDGHTGV